jgi:hypothetical protein
LDIWDKIALGVVCGAFAMGMGYLSYKMPMWMYMLANGKSQCELTEEDMREISKSYEPPGYL